MYCCCVAYYFISIAIDLPLSIDCTCMIMHIHVFVCLIAQNHITCTHTHLHGSLCKNNILYLHMHETKDESLFDGFVYGICLAVYPASHPLILVGQEGHSDALSKY